MDEKNNQRDWLIDRGGILQDYSPKTDSKFSVLITDFNEENFKKICRNNPVYYWEKYQELKNARYEKSSLALVNKMHVIWGKEIEVSVIVPVYNVERYINECLKSLVEQSLLQLEIIIVDDGSIDKSTSIAEKYVKQCPNFIRLIRKNNGGLGSARNAGLKHAKGRYVGYVDSDDYVDSQMYEKLYKEALKGNDIVMCGMTAINNLDGSIAWKYVVPKDIDLSDMKEVVKNSTIRISPGACNKLFKRTLIDKISWGGGFYEDLQATPTYLSYSKKVSSIDESLYFYRVNRVGSIMFTRRNDKRCLSFIKSWENFLKYANSEYQKEIEYAIYIHIVDILKAFPAFIDEFMIYFERNRKIWRNNFLIQNLLNNKLTLDLFNLRRIPKVIHYIKFEGDENTELQQRCFKTWDEEISGYELCKWKKEKNKFQNKYLKEAMNFGNWSYIKDYIKFSKLYEYGGIYLEPDVQCNKPIDGLRLNELFFALEDETNINWGVIGCIKGSKTIKKILELYEKDSFLSNYAKKDYSSNLIDKYVWELLREDHKIDIADENKYVGDGVVVFPPNVLTINCNDGLNIFDRHYEGRKNPYNLDMSYKYYLTKQYFYSEFLNERKLTKNLSDSVLVRIKQAIKVQGLKRAVRYILKKIKRKIMYNG